MPRLLSFGLAALGAVMTAVVLGVGALGIFAIMLILFGGGG